MLARRPIGTTGIEVTTLGFGGAPLGAVGGHISDDDAQHIVQLALAGGIRYFDTAPLYGHGLSEKRLGHALRNLAADGVVLSSKVGRLLVAPDQGVRDAQMRDNEPVAVRYDYSHAAARSSLLASLERLGLERIDIVLCHDIDVWTHGADQPEVFARACNGVLPALAELKREGVIGAFGLGVNEWQVCAAVLERFSAAELPIDCFLLAGRFTLLEQEPLTTLLPACVERGVAVIVGGPFNSGLLAARERRRATYDYKPVDDERWARAQAIRTVCARHNVDLRAAALHYPLRHPAVAAVIPGMWRPAEVQANLEFMQTSLPAALWDDLAGAGLAPHPVAPRLP